MGFLKIEVLDAFKTKAPFATGLLVFDDVATGIDIVLAAIFVAAANFKPPLLPSSSRFSICTSSEPLK